MLAYVKCVGSGHGQPGMRDTELGVEVAPLDFLAAHTPTKAEPAKSTSKPEGQTESKMDGKDPAASTDGASTELASEAGEKKGLESKDKDKDK